MGDTLVTFIAPQDQAKGYAEFRMCFETRCLTVEG